MANVQVDSAAVIKEGTRVVIRDANDRVYVFVNAGGNIRAYKGDVVGEPSSFTEQDTAGAPNDANYEGIAAAIDSVGLVSVIYYFFDPAAHGAVPNIRYAQFRTSAHATTQDDWVLIDEAVATLDNEATISRRLAIAIDGNEVPHVIYNDRILDMGGNNVITYYGNRVGGSWNARVTILDTDFALGRTPGMDIIIAQPTNSVGEDRPIIALITNTEALFNQLRAFHGNALNATSFTDSNNINAGQNANTLPDARTSLAIDSNNDLQITWTEDVTNDLIIRTHLATQASWTSWESFELIDGARDYLAPSLAINGTNRYVFVESTSDDDIRLWKEEGSGWSEETADTDLPNVGTFEFVKVKYSPKNNNSPAELDYVFEDSGGAVQYNTFSVSAVVVKTKTFTLDAVLKKEDVTKTFTLDAVLEKVFTKTFTLDAVLKKLAVTKTFTLDAVLKKLAITKTFTMDAVLKKLGITKTFTLDAVLSVLATKTFTLDAVLLKVFTKTFTLDAVLEKVFTKTFTLDAVLQKVFTKTFTLDAVLTVLATKTFTLDAVLLKVQTRTFTFDAVLKKLAVTKTFTLDAVLKILAVTKTFTLDTVLLKVFTKTFTLDAVLKKVFTKTFTLDAVLLAIKTKTFTLDAVLEKVFTKTFTLDTVLEKVFTKTFTLDAVLEKVFTKTFTLDAVLLKIFTKAFTLDAVLKKLGVTKTFTLDVVLKKLAITKTFTLDAVLTTLASKTFTLDAVLNILKTKTFTLDAVLKKLAVTKTFTLDTFLDVGVPLIPPSDVKKSILQEMPYKTIPKHMIRTKQVVRAPVPVEVRLEIRGPLFEKLTTKLQITGKLRDVVSTSLKIKSNLTETVKASLGIRSKLTDEIQAKFEVRGKQSHKSFLEFLRQYLKYTDTEED